MKSSKNYNGEGGIRTRGTGLNPYDGLANRCQDIPKPLSHKVVTKSHKSYCAKNCAIFDPGLARIVEVWPELPEHIRKAGGIGVRG